MTSPTILVVPRELDFIVPILEDSYRVLRLWEGPHGDELEQTRALICLGHQSLRELIATLPSLGLVACYTTGYDGVDVEGLSRRGIQVSHSPMVTAEPVSEFALALIFASYRNIVRGHDQVRSGVWVKDGVPLIGRLVSEARIGIVGLGAIGTALASKCEVLGMKVSWWGPRDKPNAPWPKANSLEDLARSTDILAVCASSDADNEGMISANVIEAVGPNGLLVNVGRGQLIDEDSLIEALKSDRLGAAALDVFASEPTSAMRWRDVPNVICTPHIAGATWESLGRMTAMCRSNLDAFFAGLPLPNPVLRVRN